MSVPEIGFPVDPLTTILVVLAGATVFWFAFTEKRFAMPLEMYERVGLSISPKAAVFLSRGALISSVLALLIPVWMTGEIILVPHGIVIHAAGSIISIITWQIVKRRRAA